MLLFVPSLANMTDKPTRVNRLRASKNLLLGLSATMGTTSPEQVLKNFVEILKSSSPALKLAIALLTPWAMLLTYSSNYRLIRRFFKHRERPFSGELVRFSHDSGFSSPKHASVSLDDRTWTRQECKIAGFDTAAIFSQEAL